MLTLPSPIVTPCHWCGVPNKTWPKPYVAQAAMRGPRTIRKHRRCRHTRALCAPAAARSQSCASGRNTAPVVARPVGGIPGVNAKRASSGVGALGFAPRHAPRLSEKLSRPRSGGETSVLHRPRSRLGDRLAPGRSAARERRDSREGLRVSTEVEVTEVSRRRPIATRGLPVSGARSPPGCASSPRRLADRNAAVHDERSPEPGVLTSSRRGLRTAPGSSGPSP